MENPLVPISKMAELHHLTRQTLIYYDRIDLLKPVYVNEHGYRYYSMYQIPFLREICLLKKLGLSLKDIKDSMENRNSCSVIELLNEQKQKVDKQIQELSTIRMHLEQRIHFYEETHETHPLKTPILKQLPLRKILFVPFSAKPTKDVLHLTLMKAWNVLFDYDTIPSNGFGTLIRQEQFDQEELYKDSGIFVVVSEPQCEIPGVIDVPGGTFACMYKYSFPYEEEDFRFLKDWIRTQNYSIGGDALDLCMLDTTFYTPEHEVDFCCLQIPVKKNKYFLDYIVTI